MERWKVFCEDAVVTYDPGVTPELLDGVLFMMRDGKFLAAYKDWQRVVMIEGGEE